MRLISGHGDYFPRSSFPRHRQGNEARRSRSPDPAMVRGARPRRGSRSDRTRERAGEFCAPLSDSDADCCACRSANDGGSGARDPWWWNRGRAHRGLSSPWIAVRQEMCRRRSRSWRSTRTASQEGRTREIAARLPSLFARSPPRVPRSNAPVCRSTPPRNDTHAEGRSAVPRSAGTMANRARTRASRAQLRART